MALIGLTTFLPMYVQGVMGRSALTAGFALTMMVLGWPVGATLAARAFPRYGLRRIMRIGCICIPAGAVPFVFLTPGAPPVLAGLGSLMMGFGMGLLSTTALVLIQEIVDWSQRGSATASNLFARNLGSTLGAAVLGAVLNYSLAHAPGVGIITSEDLRRLLDAPGALGGAEAIRVALQHALHLTFVSVLGLALLIALLASFVPPVRFGHPQGAPAE
jgi:MFS family permease